MTAGDVACNDQRGPHGGTCCCKACGCVVALDSAGTRAPQPGMHVSRAAHSHHRHATNAACCQGIYPRCCPRTPPLSILARACYAVLPYSRATHHSPPPRAGAAEPPNACQHLPAYVSRHTPATPQHLTALSTPTCSLSSILPTPRLVVATPCCKPPKQTPLNKSVCKVIQE